MVTLFCTSFNGRVVEKFDELCVAQYCSIEILQTDNKSLRWSLINYDDKSRIEWLQFFE